MKREELKKLINDHVVILDGATGTNLQKAGMPVGVSPEKWILENPEVIIGLQREFIDAGTEIIYAPTFTANRIKLAQYGLENELDKINEGLVALSKEAAKGRAYVAGDMTMTGEQLYPMGTMTFDELIDVYKEQAKALCKAGVDLFVIETMMSLQETRAAVIAVREVCDLPVMVSMTFEESGRTLFGTGPESVPVVLGNLGADVVGINCSVGPEKMADIVSRMYPYSNVPILAKPNNGMPELDSEGRTVYATTPEEFALAGKMLIEKGARVVGGCCGTTPEHIRALSKAVSETKALPVLEGKERLLSSERRVLKIVPFGSFQIVGERINPTGKKKLQEELRAGRMDMVRRFAREQQAGGASVLDVNMGTNGIDEKEMMLKAIDEVTQQSDLPLCIDSSFPEVIEAALRIYPGRALINSISCESEKLKALLPIARKYGAMFILLPVSDEGIPATIEEKHAVLEAALSKAYAAGFSKEDIVVDALAATVGADKNAALSCISTIKYCADRGLATICGLSNISFGLPERMFVNSSFLAIAIGSGLTMAIANPSQDLLMNTAFASDMLMAREGSDIRYIQRMKYYNEQQEKKEAQRAAEILKNAGADGTAFGKDGNASAKDTGSNAADNNVIGSKDAEAEGGIEQNPVFNAVINGDKENIVSLAQAEIEKGMLPEDIINDILIPAINRVGVLFDKKEYFLPQLIAGANAMKEAIAFLEPRIVKKEENSDVSTIVIATVEGDVHDIGKNLVALMLRNYGFNVIDLGKDVPSELIVDTAIEKKADFIALSALMTTTMMRMKDVVLLSRERGFGGKIVIGGAAVTESFAKEIGADGYSKDAADCVKLVNRLKG